LPYIVVANQNLIESLLHFSYNSMSGIISEEEKLSGVWSHSCNDIHFINLLKEYQNFLLQFIGPDSGTLIIQHKGGLDAFITSISDLTNKIQLHHPFLKMINAFMKAQSSAYGSCGIYVGLLCVSLLIQLIELEQSETLSKRVVKDVMDELMMDIITFLELRSEAIVQKVDIGNITAMMNYTKNFVDQKNLCLSSYECDHLQTQIIRAFLSSFDETKSDDCFGEVIIKVIDGKPATEADVMQGVLYRDIDINVKLIEKIKQLHIPTNCLKILLFNIPLSYEKSDSHILKYTGNISNKNVYNSLVTNQLFQIIENVNIAIIASQKYIDEEIKYELEKKGVLVLERLGTKQTKALQKLTGAVELSDLSLILNNTFNDQQEEWVGLATSINLMDINEKTYLQILNENKNLTSVVTLILPVMITAMEENVQVIFPIGYMFEYADITYNIV